MSIFSSLSPSLFRILSFFSFFFLSFFLFTLGKAVNRLKYVGFEASHVLKSQRLRHELLVLGSWVVTGRHLIFSIRSHFRGDVSECHG